MDQILYLACLTITGITAGTASGLFRVGCGFLMTPVPVLALSLWRD
jgi:uncharacterized membrane protein YfcA